MARRNRKCRWALPPSPHDPHRARPRHRRCRRCAPADAAEPEEAAAIAVALAAQPDGPYAGDGCAALEKVLAALEPDPRRRQALARARSSCARGGPRRGCAARTRAWPGGGCWSSSTATEPARRAGARSSRSCSPARPSTVPRGLVPGAAGGPVVPADRIEGAEVTAEPAPRRDPATFGVPGRRPPPHPPAGRCAPRRRRRPLVVLPGGRRGWTSGRRSPPGRRGLHSAGDQRADDVPPHAVRPRRRLRLQDPARRARGRGRRADATAAGRPGGRAGRRARRRRRRGGGADRRAARGWC